VSSGSLALVTVGGGKIGDTVFHDWDADGVEDAEDEGVPGVTVQLFESDGTTLITSTATDSVGNYVFTGLQPQTYVVKVDSGTVPSGYTHSADAHPGDAVEDGSTTVTLVLDEEVLSVDFGYSPGGVGSIGDLVFSDQNGDGYFNGSDTGIAGITVDLYEDSNGNGAIDTDDFNVATTSTNGSGIYAFTGLAEALDYLVDVDETDTELDSHFNPDTFLSTTPTLQSVSNLSGNVDTADFGFKAEIPLNIGDTVFFDADGNGVYHAGTDSLLPSITVNLYRDSDGNNTADGPAIANTTTGLGGQYLFGGLAPDTYLV
jgi:hypothetical protein